MEGTPGVQPREYPPGSVVVEQGEIGNEIFFCMSGEFNVVRDRPRGRYMRYPRFSKKTEAGPAGFPGKEMKHSMIARTIVFLIIPKETNGFGDMESNGFQVPRRKLSRAKVPCKVGRGRKLKGNP